MSDRNPYFMRSRGSPLVVCSFSSACGNVFDEGGLVKESVMETCLNEVVSKVYLRRSIVRPTALCFEGKAIHELLVCSVLEKLVKEAWSRRSVEPTIDEVVCLVFVSRRGRV